MKAHVPDRHVEAIIGRGLAARQYLKGRFGH